VFFGKIKINDQTKNQLCFILINFQQFSLHVSPHYEKNNGFPHPSKEKGGKKPSHNTKLDIIVH
jgi:hypothetical protein